mmetsp:Transcript_39201/g.82218  ORF Transcript_39201/g.82218 Transcript_39201/m.82218 type:complete len:90 (-) Transcript_39201:383-652(-)|eukprot:6205834-Pleurochrysis_carterae.AAC.2
MKSAHDRKAGIVWPRGRLHAWLWATQAAGNEARPLRENGGVFSNLMGKGPVAGSETDETRSARAAMPEVEHTHTRAHTPHSEIRSRTHG